jgi:hypothetical protein
MIENYGTAKVTRNPYVVCFAGDGTHYERVPTRNAFQPLSRRASAVVATSVEDKNQVGEDIHVAQRDE